MNNVNLLSVITPIFNRADLLPGCYESLRKQTCMDFEWIIVDDGSSDDTEAVVQGFEPADFSVTYIKKENGGKHTALNASYPYIRGKYVLILDSDDYLTPNAVERAKACWQIYEDREEVGIVIFQRGKSLGEPLCIVRDYDQPVDILRYKRTAVHSMDCCEVLRAELLKKYPFPVFEGERFVAECALWNRVALTHKCVYINEVIYICEYLEGGLTDSGRPMRIRNPRGGMFICNLRMGSNNFMSQRIKYGLLYTCYGHFAGMTPAEMAKQCSNPGVMWVCLPFGWALYQYWKHKYQKQ